MKKSFLFITSLILVFALVIASGCSNKSRQSNSVFSSDSLLESSVVKSENSQISTEKSQNSQPISQFLPNSTDSSNSLESSLSGSPNQSSGLNQTELNNLKLINDFVKYSKDADTLQVDIGAPNTSTEKYALVPDLYVNYNEVSEGDIFASPSGSSSGNGNIDSPYDYKTAISKLTAGKTLFLLEGVYTVSKTISLYASGTRKDYINITAYQKKQVVFDCSQMELDGSNCGIKVVGNFWHISGITVKGAGDNGIYVKGSFNVLDDIVARNNRDTGIQIGGGVSTVFNEWPHDNLVRNCTSFDNCCETGENADGFAAKLSVANNNTFDGCIAHNNADDGWDLYAYADPGSIGRVIICNSIAIYNGKLLDGTAMEAGDRNGYKLGSNQDADGSNHYMYNCYAFKNYSKGYTDNWNKGGFMLENCTGHDNFNANYKLNGGTGKMVAKNLLSAKPGENEYDKYNGTVYNSLFHKEGFHYYLTSVVGTDAKITTDGIVKTYSNYDEMFESTVAPLESENLHKTLRNSDGSINLGNYLKLKESSPWQTMGEGGKPLGANLNKSVYNLSLDEINGEIQALPNPTYTSQYYAKLYRLAKALSKLSQADYLKVNNLNKVIIGINSYNDLSK